MRDVWRWRDRSQTERVELYTVVSLHVILWFLLLSVLLPVVVDARDDAALPFLLALLAAGGLLGAWCLHRATATYPEPGRPWAALGVLAGLSLAAAIVSRSLPEPADLSGGVAALLLLSWCGSGFTGRAWRWGMVAASGALLWLATDWPLMGVLGLGVGGFFVFTVQVSLWLVDVVRQLERARDTEAALAVAEERLRFSRDVHDVLGRRLSTIGVQAELAAALADRSDPGAADQIRTVRQTAHEGLREAREIARGYRSLDLDQEVQGALALLRSAGIEAHADVVGLPPEWQEVAARTIREAVTNVLRHSRARRVSMAYADEALTIRNDGVVADRAGGGSGLTALAEHVRVHGGRLETGVEDGVDGDEFVVRTQFRHTGGGDP